jgi:hypothetical protein
MVFQKVDEIIAPLVLRQPRLVGDGRQQDFIGLPGFSDAFQRSNRPLISDSVTALHVTDVSAKAGRETRVKASAARYVFIMSLPSLMKGER